MSKAIFAAYREPHLRDFKRFGYLASKELAPDNASISEPYTYYNHKILTLIYNPSPTVEINGPSFRLGLSEESDSLLTPYAEIPKGSFALFRVTDVNVEIATDYASSRTIWYYNDESVFIASTSQRLIISLLGTFEFNEKACGWFLCTGTLGPDQSWDRRLNMLPPRATLCLDRDEWEVTINHNDDFSFDKEGKGNITKTEYKKRLQKAVACSVENLQIDASQWALALSGGIDSRGILYHLKEDERLKTVTWGLRSSMNIETSDASIAQRLAKICSLEHHYAEMDYIENSFSTLLNRFLLAGEGRVDHLAGYLDALELWGRLSLSGRGMIRGYDAFGRKPPVANEYQVRRTCNLALWNLDRVRELPKEYKMSDRDIPKHLRRMEEESLEDWRDRLWIQFRTPVITASLEDIKLSYIEVINPLLGEKVVRTIQELPIELRENKRIWHDIVSGMFPEIPFAKRDSTQDVSQFLRRPDIKQYVCQELIARSNDSVFPKNYMQYLVDNYHRNQKSDAIRGRIRRLVKAYLPQRIENFLRSQVNSDPLSTQFLAMRTLLVVKINEMYIKDAGILENSKQ